MFKIKDIFRKLVYGAKSDSESYIKYLRKTGITVGDDCTVYAPTKTLIDVQYPWMITIGNHVRITEGVKIIAHDYSWSVLKCLNGGIFGASGPITIGNNVFIGMNSIITRNVIIGDNVVIGAGSIVTKDCESNSVYAGNPARRIMAIDEFCRKRFESQKYEAKILAVNYMKRYGKRPEKEVFHEYFMLFCEHDEVQDNKVYSEKLNLCCNREESLGYLYEHKPPFRDYDEFMRYCFENE